MALLIISTFSALYITSLTCPSRNYKPQTSISFNNGPNLFRFERKPDINFHSSYSSAVELAP